MSDAPTALLWIDLETTGFDPIRDKVIEWAAIITDLAGDPIADADGRVRVPPRLRHGMPAADFHKSTGLWERIVWADDDRDAELSAAAADRAIASLIAAATGADVLLAGSSVHFDRGFINHHMPRVRRMLHHRQVDVSSLVVLLSSLGVPSPGPRRERHRAVEDIEDSLGTYRAIRALLAGSGVGAPARV
jgi:oligoribonuclease